jgi:adenosylmethionine-8-amino-7-oxononanoate aminotransferase
VFTGFARTGSLFACQSAHVIPDIAILGKALTGGTLPLAATVANARVFEAFRCDDPQRALMHGPTFMGNPLACAAANASLDLFEREDRVSEVRCVERQLIAALAPVRDLSGVKEVRVRGAIGVVELDALPDMARLQRRFIEAGVWLRPFRNIVYLTPALNIDPKDLTTLTATVEQVLGERRPQ